MATIEDFQAVDIRVGRIVDVDELPGAKKPSYRLRIDLGPEVGIKVSCAQLTQNYARKDLEGRKVLCVVNFPPRQIGRAQSEVLTLGVPDEQGNAVLVEPERDAPVGGRLY
jgi:tRNA-binding protein